MSTSRPIGAAMAVLVAVALLAGCAPSAVSPTAESSHPSDPTPTASPEPVAVPGPRTPLTCEEFVEGGGLGTLMDSEPEYFPSQLSYPVDAAIAQKGVLRCHWRTDDGSFSSVLAPLDIWSEAPSGAPDHCSVTEEHGQCGGFRVLDGFALQAMLVVFRSGLDEAVLSDGADALLTTMMGNAAAGGILPAWHQPERGTAEYGDCSALDSAQIDATLEPLSPAGNHGSGDGFSSVYQAMDAAGYGSCSWEIPHPDHPLPVYGSFAVEFTPGGAWAFEPAGGEAIEVVGADEAVVTCNEITCGISARVGDSWVWGGFGNNEYDDATAARYLAAIIPSLPIEPAP
jgi:hypothetical protein